MVRMMVELVEDIVVLVFLEAKRAILEIKENVKSVEKGAALLVMGGGVLVFAALTFVATAVIALAIWLPVWLSALVVALGLSFLGVAFLFTGLGHFKGFTLIPSRTIHRIEDVFKQYKKVSAQHEEAHEQAERQRARIEARSRRMTSSGPPKPEAAEPGAEHRTERAA